MTATTVLEYSARQEEREQLFIRATTNGSLIERDHLLGYTVGEFYQERSLFIKENEIRAMEIEKYKSKK